MGGDEGRGPLLVAGETCPTAPLPVCGALLWGKLAPSGLLFGLKAACAFGPPTEEVLLKDFFLTAGVS